MSTITLADKNIREKTIMIIRKVKEQDLRAIASLYKGFWNEESCMGKMESTLSLLNKHPDYIILSAIENKKVVGTITGIICHQLYGDCKPFLVIENFVVDVTYRRRGIGKALFKRIESMAKKKKCCQIQLITDSFRKGSQRFYESVGFPKGIHKGYKKEIEYKIAWKTAGLR